MVVEVNKSLADGYVRAFNELSATYGIENNLNAGLLARMNDVLVVRKAEADEDRIWNAVKSVAEKAVDKFISMREIEGEKLRDDIVSRADLILGYVEFVEERSPETVKEYNEKLLARMQELLGDIHVEESRLLTEAAIYADKIAVDEETVRLRSHLSQLDAMLTAGGAIGRKLDFLLQEFNREANTIGSKGNDLEQARTVVEIKAELEKIREQTQNIE